MVMGCIMAPVSCENKEIIIIRKVAGIKFFSCRDLF
jgi:hypothetical protein